jgi:hypothetical protein
MVCRRRRVRNLVCVLSVAWLTILLSGPAAAKKPPKTYPDEGTVIALGTTEHTVNGVSFGHGTSVTGKYSHVYRVRAATEILELDCGQLAVFHSIGSECGGDKPIKLGDVIHYRIEKDWVYIPVTQTVRENPYDDANHRMRQEQGEQKLRILSRELKSDASTGTSQEKDEKSDAKPSEAKQ